MSSWGKKDFKKCYMLMISFLTAILSAPFCTYMIMKQFAWNLHLFKFRKLPCWERTPALLNTTLINHSYRVDITFLLNSQWAGKLALPAITILISLGNVFIYKVPLPYLEPFIHPLLTREGISLSAGNKPYSRYDVTSPTSSCFWPIIFLRHKYPLVPLVICCSPNFLFVFPI